MPDFDCSQLDQDSDNSRQGFRGQEELPDCERAESKTIHARQKNVVKVSCLAVSVPKQTKTRHRNTVVMVSCLTLYVPRWNAMTVILDISSCS